jgi:hypothetical protein
MAQKNRQQVFLAAEGQENVSIALATLVVSGAKNYLNIDPSLDFDVASIQRKVNRTSHTPAQPIPGLKTGTLKFGVEVTGALSLSDRSMLHTPLQICGFRAEILKKAAIGAITPGTSASPATIYTRFLHGEGIAIDSDPTTRIGTVCRDTYDGDPHIYFAAGSELGNATLPVSGDTLVGMTSKCEVDLTADAVANAAWGYWPSSERRLTMVFSTLSNSLAVGDVLQGATSGATALVQVAASSGSTISVYATPTGGTFSASETIKRLTPNADSDVGTTSSVTLTICPTGSGALTNDGVWEGLYGLAGTSTHRFPIGDLPITTFEMKGSYLDCKDGANVTPTSPASWALPAPFLQAGFQIGNTNAAGRSAFKSPCLATIEVAMNNDLQQRQCANSSTGVLGYEIVGRAPSCTIDPDLDLEAIFPVIGNLIGSQNVCLDWIVRPVDITQRDNRVFLYQIPQAAITVSTKADRNGRLVRNLTLVPNSGDTSLVHDHDFVIVHDFTIDSGTGI